jgi:phage-related protein
MAVWGVISAGFGMAWDFISSVFGQVAGFLGGIWGNIVDGVSGMIGQVGGFFSGLWDTITGALSGAGTWLFDAGKNIVDGLFSGIKSLAGTIGNFFLGLLPGWIVEPFKIALGIASPSKLFRQFGRHIGEGLMLGTGDTKDDIGATMRDLVTVPDMPSFGAPSASIAGGGRGSGGATFNTTINQVDDPIGTAHAVTRRQLALSS